MILEGCQARPRTPTWEVRQCPQCGAEIELFSIDTAVTCDHCGFVAYNDALSCVQWCKYAKRCVGEDMYGRLMQVAQTQSQRRQEKAKSPAAPAR